MPLVVFAGVVSVVLAVIADKKKVTPLVTN
jgi:hypothetical protein